MTDHTYRPSSRVHGGVGLALVACLTACSTVTGSDGSSGPVPRAAHTRAAPAPRDTGQTDGATGAPTTRPPAEASSNPTVRTAEDRLSTFALDVDNAAYTRSRRMITAGVRPSPSDVRTEEFVNNFPQDYAPPSEGIDVRMDGTAVPWLPERSRVLRVGVQSAAVDQAKRPDADLTFVIDVSGSMAEENKLPAVQQALRTLTQALRPTDTVTIVVYSDRTRTVLQRTPAREARTIIGVIDDLRTEGSTNAEAGLKRGYDEASKHAQAGRLNRVVLLSDGVANVGNTGPDAILRTIGDAARRQIDLVTVGFGDGYNDPLMERLADRGNGFYAYCDTAKEASRLFRENLTGTLVVTGRDAKAQVEFDPAQVESYRLLGYENRDVADGDFRNDKVDGGEVGSGNSVTALYQVDLAPGADPSRPLARSTVRYLHPDTRESVERTAAVRPADLSPSVSQAPVRLQQDVVVAAFSESLRGGPWAAVRTRQQVADDAAALAARRPDPELAELADLTRRVKRL